MTEDSSQTNNLENYDVDFVDPEFLVGFISDIREHNSKDISLPSAGAPAQEKVEAQEEQETQSEPKLKFAESIKDSKDSSSEYIKKRQEDTRGRLAVLYTIFTFLIFLIVIIVGVIDGLVRHVSIVENLNTLLPLVSGIFLGSLGFVLGYYFRKENK